ARQGCGVSAGRAGKRADRGDISRQSGNDVRGAEPIRRHNYVSRGNEIVERRHRAYRSHVIAADRELVTKKESFVNRHAFYERERICVSNLRRRGETADSSDQDAEPEHFGKLGSLPSNRIKLGEFKRRFI